MLEDMDPIFNVVLLLLNDWLLLIDERDAE